MTKAPTEAVRPPALAVLLDFENLIYGLQGNNAAGGRAPMLFDLDLIIDHARSLGFVAVLRAYADWRFKEVNQHQVALERAGFDLVHVFSSFGWSVRKNSADVRMAIDATESIWTLPHVQNYLIVSGDRDFVHVIKTLRRHGKGTYGVAVAASLSPDLASVCDGFRSYSDLLREARGQGAMETTTRAVVFDSMAMEKAKQVLGIIVATAPEGMLGSALKCAIVEALPSFDEAELGFANFKMFLCSVPGVVSVEGGDGPGDIMVRPSAAGASRQVATADGAGIGLKNIMRRANLRRMRFIMSPPQRRAILERFYIAMSSPQGFCWADVIEHMMLVEEEPPGQSRSFYAKVWQSLYYGRAIDLSSGNEKDPMRNRIIRLDASIRSADDLLAVYERFAVSQVIKTFGANLNPIVLFDLLGFDPNDERARERISRLLREVESRSEQLGLIATGSAAADEAEHANDAAPEMA